MLSRTSGFILLSLMVLSTVVASISTEAATISVNFHYRPDEGAAVMLAPTDVAGFVPTANWNNVNTAGAGSGRAGAYSQFTSGAIVNNLGAPTTMTVRGTGWISNSVSEKLNPLDTTNPNRVMMTSSGISGINPAVGVDGPFYSQIQLTNALAAAGGNYDVYVYYGTGYDGDFMGGAGNMYLSAGGYTVPASNVDPLRNDIPGVTLATQAMRTIRGTANGSGTGPTWDNGTGFNISTGSGDQGNYVLFSNISAADLVLTVQPTGGAAWDQIGILGIQLVGPQAAPAAVPEPATLVLCSVFGLVGLAFGFRRLRK